MLFGIILFATSAIAQTNHYNTTDTVFQFVDQRPEFPGGFAALMAFFSENIIHPADIQDTGWQGRIMIQFVVRKTGEISDVNIFHEVFPPLDKEVLRIAKLMPNWIPGKHNGERVSVKYILPINLNIQPRIYDEAPQFPGGDEALLQYLIENIQYPPDREEGELPTGRVTVQFNVLTSGKISDIEVVSSVSPKVDAEVVRVVETIPNWIPAKRQGEKVDAPFRLPINFYIICINCSPPRYIFTAEQQPGDFIFPLVEQRPEFPGGTPAMMEFLRLNIRYPTNALRRGVEGQVSVSFIVERNGRVEDVQLVESTIFYPSGAALEERSPIRRSMEQEAMRVVGRMPNWIPGKQLGRNVRVRFTIPIQFRI